MYGIADTSAPEGSSRGWLKFITPDFTLGLFSGKDSARRYETEGLANKALVEIHSACQTESDRLWFIKLRVLPLPDRNVA